ncbi:MAG: LacI family DNA-binding transcriptional regulator [Anaerolineae bacterium]|nr:LacI family DNA-binding transcriptional regulator [Anaerolineae bacterium]
MPRKRVTSQDVAELAGVSRTTVSFVLNNVPGMKISQETRQRVLEAARQLNYYPASAARSLARGRTNFIGLVLCQSPTSIFADAFLPEVIRGLGEVAQEHGFRILLESVEDVTRPDAYISLVREKYIDGLIVSGPRSDDAQLPQLAQEGFPIVLLGQLNDVNFCFVDVDNVGAARMATEHLIALGHQRIGLITNAPPQYTASRDRQRGYRLALEAHGIAYDPNLVRYGNFREESGYEAMSQLLKLTERPTAMFVACDLVAFGAMEAIKEHGLAIPEDIALVGFDDVRLAPYVDPPLTTVRLPAYEQGRRAGDLLIRLIRGEKDMETQILLETELVVRESCGASSR